MNYAICISATILFSHRSRRAHDIAMWPGVCGHFIKFFQLWSGCDIANKPRTEIETFHGRGRSASEFRIETIKSWWVRQHMYNVRITAEWLDGITANTLLIQCHAHFWVKMCIQNGPFTFKLTTTVFIALNNIVLYLLGLAGRGARLTSIHHAHRNH